jgi:hypothetical protein
MLTCALLLLVGCGQEVDLVKAGGVVTLDGKPLPGARVLFRPAQGRPSAGTTDAEGRYSLQYTAEKLGVLPGQHSVAITTAVESSEDARPVKETLPSRYNRQTTLTATVDAGHQTHDFSLQSK